MRPLLVPGLGLPDFYLLLPIATVTAAVLSVALAFFVSTYVRVGVSALVPAIVWLAVAVIYGVRPEFALGVAAILVLIALAVHALGRRVRNGA
jgi:hypothetical protein